MFVMRLSKLELLTEMKAKIVPPNPLFSPCRRSVGEYMQKRRLLEAEIRGQAHAGSNTQIKDIASAVLADRPADELPALMEPLRHGVGNVALLMAADGYGHAKVNGIEERCEVIIRTSENLKSFMFNGNPNPALLFEHAESVIRRVNEERRLAHS